MMTVAAAERRAETILDALAGHPLDIRHRLDLVVVIDGQAMPWIVDHDRITTTLSLLGIRSAHQDEVLGGEPPAGHVRALVYVGGHVVPRWIRLRALQRGGDA